jgi:hypothetical protein
MQDLSMESFSYELQFDMHFYMHSYLHKIFILVKSGCYMDFPLTTLIGIVGKRKHLLTCTQKTTRVKLERLCSAKLIQGDQKITSRHAEVLTRLKDS